MATTTSITTTYAGEFAGDYISAALLSGNTLNRGNIEIKPNVKFKEVIKKVATDANVIKDATCDFSDTATVTLTERILQPEEFQVNLELCKKDFRSDWEAIQMGYSAYDNLPPKFSDFLIGHVADSIPNAVYGKEDLKIYVPPVAFQAYVRHLGGYGANGLGAQGYDNKGNQWYESNASLSFEGIEVVYTSGMPSDHIVAGQKSNLYFGTGLIADHNEVKVLDMADLDGSQNVRVVMRFTSGIQYGIGSDLVLLTLA
jgi:hypothetical protein